MTYLSQQVVLLVCDVCSVEAGIDTSGETPEEAIVNARHYGWRHVDSSWHACPACFESREFIDGLSAAQALIKEGDKPQAAWKRVKTLMKNNMLTPSMVDR